MESPASFAQWLASTDLSHAARAALTKVGWLSPTIQTLHLLSIAAVIGSAGAINLRLAGFSGLQHPTANLVRRFTPIIWSALVVMLLTGSLLIVNRPTRYFGNWSFLTKVALLLLAILITLFVQVAVRRNPTFWESPPTMLTTARVVAICTLMIWIAIIFAGRLIAYMY